MGSNTWALLGMLPTLAQMSDEDAAAMGFVAGMLGVFCCMMVVVLAIWIWVIMFLQKILKALPVEHQKQQPGMLWLLLIPFFNLVWNFFVFPKISESFDSYFASRGQSGVDTGKNLALAYCICAACSIVPYIGALPGIAALVLLIILLVKFNGLKKQIAG